MANIEQDAKLCQDYGAPDCLGTIDDRYTMSFADIGQPSIYWCANCGPRAHSLNEALSKRFEEDPDFCEKLRAAIEEVETRQQQLE